MMSGEGRTLETGTRDVPEVGLESRGYQPPELAFQEFVKSYEEMRRRNAELERSNSHLQAALKEATQRLVRIEQSLSAMSRLSKFATATAAQMLGRALEQTEANRSALRSRIEGRRGEVRERALSMQKEVFSLLEGAQDEAVSELRKSEDCALEIFRKTRESILALGEDLERMAGSAAGQPVPAEAGADSPTAETVQVRPERPAQPATAEAGPNSQAHYATAIESAPTSTAQPKADRPIQSAPAWLEPTTGARGTAPRPAETVPTWPEQPPIEECAPAWPVQPPTAAAAPSGPTWNGQAAPERPTQVAPMAGPEPERAAKVQSVEVLASPLDDLASLGRFVQEIKRSPGISNVRPLGFENRVLRLSVEFEGAAALRALMGLPGFTTRVVSVAAERIEVMVLGEGGSA